jgi:hypothetical protein
MIKELMYKWFGLDPIPCATCEVLKETLSIERQFNQVLLQKLLDKGKPEPLQEVEEKPVPIQPQFIPWRVRQQMLEAEDRKKAELMRAKGAEIEKLEKELGVTNAS